VKSSEVHDLSKDELELRLADMREAGMKLRFSHATAQLDSSSEMRNNRRDIARVLTVLRELEIKEAKGA